MTASGGRKFYIIVVQLSLYFSLSKILNIDLDCSVSSVPWIVPGYSRGYLPTYWRVFRNRVHRGQGVYRPRIRRPESRWPGKSRTQRSSVCSGRACSQEQNRRVPSGWRWNFCHGKKSMRHINANSFINCARFLKKFLINKTCCM